MKFLQTEGSLVNMAHINSICCLPNYGEKSGKAILTHWIVEIVTTCGGSFDLGHFDSEHDAEVYLADLVVKLDIEIVKG